MTSLFSEKAVSPNAPLARASSKGGAMFFRFQRRYFYIALLFVLLLAVSYRHSRVPHPSHIEEYEELGSHINNAPQAHRSEGAHNSKEHDVSPEPARVDTGGGHSAQTETNRQDPAPETSTALSQAELEGYVSALDKLEDVATQTQSLAHTEPTSTLDAPQTTPTEVTQSEKESKGASEAPSPKSKALVMGLTSSATPLWLFTMPSDWDIIKYIVDDPKAELTVPKNEGREAMVYLTYIIDNYHSLPDYIVFAHGEYRSWHQPEPFTYIVKALNLTAVDEHGWVNLRCDLEPSCTKTPVDSWAYTDNWSWWSFVLRAMFGHIYQESDSWYPENLTVIEKPTPMKIPYSFASPCCAQFAVSKAAVLSKPLKFWQRAREPLLLTKEQWAPDLDANYADSWHLGVGYERLWHYFFGLPAHVCLEEEYCRSVIYQDRIKCDGSSKKWGKDYEKVNCKLIE